MDFQESLSMASRALIANKLRSTLTMLGIIIGNASVIAMVGIGEGAQRLISEQFEELGPNVLFVLPGNQEARQTTFEIPRTLVLADADAIAEQVPSVESVAPQISGQQIISYQGNNASKNIMGVTPEFLEVRRFKLARGRFISSKDVSRNTAFAVIGPGLIPQIFQGKDPIGKQLRVKDMTFEVVGVLEEKGSFLGQDQDSVVYVPITTMANRLVGRTSPYGTEVTFISVAAQGDESISAAEFQIRNLLRLRHRIVNDDDFEVDTQKGILQIVETVTTALTLMLAAIAAISLLVGGIGIMNIMLVSVSERTQEIGLRKAIGATQRDIQTQFMIESFILSATGGVAGTGVGMAIVMVIGLVSPLSAVISPGAIVLAVSISGAIGLFFGVVPARQAAKLDPIVALRRN